MTPRVHVFLADSQPATNWVDRHGPGRPVRVRTNPRRQIRCWSCDRLRYAKNLRVRVYYDCVQVFCAKGCKA